MEFLKKIRNKGKNLLGHIPIKKIVEVSLLTKIEPYVNANECVYGNPSACRSHFGSSCLQLKADLWPGVARVKARPKKG